MHDHGGALDYDLMTLTAYTIDDVGGRLPVGSLAHFLQNLPPDSATMRELFPEEAERVAWMGGRATAQLVACLIDEVRGLQWLYQSAHHRGSVRRPRPIETPWTDERDSGVRRIGSEPVTIAEFDAWFDGE